MNGNKTLGDKFSERFPHSTSLVWLVKSGVTFTGLSLPMLGFYYTQSSQYSISGMFKYFGYIFISIGAVFLFGFLILFLSELFQFNKISPYAKDFFKLITLKTVGFFVGIKKLYFKLISKIIGGAVKEIITQRMAGQDSYFSFQKQQNDDHYYPESFNLEKNNLEIKISPDNNTKYWRMGFKFSQNEAFTNARHAPGFPLFHLTRGSHIELNNRYENVLRATFYNESGGMVYAQPGKIIQSIYNNEELYIKVCRNLESKETRVVVLNKSREELAVENIGNFQFCQLFAWSDSEKYFKIDTKIYRK